jgi:spore germination protein GerM
MTRRRTRALLAVGTAAALLVGAGCGLRADEEPQVISADDLPSDLVQTTSTTDTDSTATEPATVYLLVREADATKLVEVQRLVEDPDRPADRIEAVLAQVSPEEQARGLVSSIPADTVLLDATLDEEDQELVVNLSGALFDIEGRELAYAFAQIVLTATELEGVRQVSFEVDGEPYRAPNAEGIEQPGAVTAADYSTLIDRS